jgi:hypothetical protein
MSAVNVPAGLYDPIPDPAVDYFGYHRSMANKLVALTSCVTEIIEFYELRKYDTQSLADFLDISRSKLEHKPWMLPRYGKADWIGAGGRKYWFGATVKAWYSVPESDRKLEWDAMSPKEKSKARGVAA